MSDNYKLLEQILISAIADAQGIFHMDITEDCIINIAGNTKSIDRIDDFDSVDKLIRRLAQYVSDEEQRQPAFEYFCRESLQKAYEAGKTELNRENLSYFYDGSIRPCRITAKLVINPNNGHLHAILFGTDITDEWQERKKHEAEVKEQLAIFNALADGYANVFLIDLPNDMTRILKLDGYVTTGMTKDNSMGYSYTGLARQYISERVHPKDQAYMYEAMAGESVERHLATSKDYVGTYRVKIDEETHYYQFKYIKLESSNHVIAGFQNIDDTVQELQKQQKEMALALAAAEQSNRAKTVFLNSMSHDIRTPMNAIIGFAALAQAHIDDTRQVQDYLKKINTSSTHLLSLINDILDMSRIESGTVKLEEKPIHIPDLLNDLRTMIQGLVNGRKQNLFIDIQDVRNENIMADKLRLNQVLINIVSNAIKFTPVGGDIMIRLVEKASSKANYATYEISIKDNGIGMSQEFLSHVFDTFAREHSATVSGIQGTGLGMAITKNIVDMMGGSIQVESQEGKGTKFVVTLSFRLPEPVKAVEQGVVATQEEYDFTGRRILLVEDNELNREIAATILKDMGIEVDTAEDGLEAVNIIHRAPEDKYDLIFMDIQMPKMDGYMATREIRTLKNNEKANIPIVAMTANAFEKDKRKAMESGMNGHIAKPLDIGIIKQTLAEVFKS